MDKNKEETPRLSSSWRRALKCGALRWKEIYFIETHWGLADERKNLLLIVLCGGKEICQDFLKEILFSFCKKKFLGNF
jgi:hypothetical protein